jgi:tyrosyl-tRNA synthetase
MSFVEELTWRGLLSQTTDPSLAEKMRAEKFTLYSGFDPTGSSLHVGHMMPILTLMRAQKAGHRPLALVGGATGMVGDPSGKTEERKLLGKDELAKNVEAIRAQLGRFLDFSPSGGAQLVNNHEWFQGFTFLEFLRDVGKHFSVNMMLGKESVRARLEDRDQGISYTEFSYMLIQAYDFLWLHDHYQCQLQAGGTDQWGNITAGVELIRRMRQKTAYGLTTPLITTASGQKFGKTEKGAVWLDPARTSPYEFHQFFLRTEDKDVGRLLRFYTFLSEPEVRELEEQVRTAPQKREAQRVLARQVTTLVHGAEETRKAEDAAEALFSRGAEGTVVAPPGAPTSDEARGALLAGMALLDLLVKTNLASSKGAARRDIEGGGIYLNDERVDDPARTLQEKDLREGNLILLRKGKKTYHVVRFV